MYVVKHTFICGKINGETVQSEVFENLYNGNIRQQVEVLRKFEDNLNTTNWRQKIKTKEKLYPHVIYINIYANGIAEKNKRGGGLQTLTCAPPDLI